MTVQFAVESVSSLLWNRCPVCRGIHNNVRSIVTGMAFGLYLGGIELFLNFPLHEPLSDERQMFFEAIDCPRSDDVLVIDRGFPCRWLVSALTARRIPFCIRCDLSRGFEVVREFPQSGRSEQVVVLRAPSARDAKDYECPVLSHAYKQL